ncbi:HNH endonuclease [Mesorhizobium qingshengii]|uniref:ATPase family associated with various cellular activities (AAA) n=1 Tax=Mesorhizobium qingshengii TaxID=1165689 RepID=A0A1G5ZSN2_9HYPH|nr:HNH endonuclease [Mesorhizobium qingshengii]SDA97848.1 ATPase family associated with various cellular activities (AAA) [Mesorhizobium qingshengii]
MAPQLEKNLLKFLQYGVSQDLGQRAVAAALTVTKVRAASQKDLVDKGFLKDEAKALKDAVARQPIDEVVLLLLLERSNYLCNCCKGDKGQSFIVHHIDEYSTSQDNGYDNLIVLCPTCHDQAHRSSNQLTLSIKPEWLRYNKANWEVEVERRNAERAIRIPESEVSTAEPGEALALPQPKAVQTRVIVLNFEGSAEDFNVQRVDAIIDSLRQITGDAGLQLVATERGSFLMLIRTTADGKAKIDTPETRALLLRELNAILTNVVDEQSFRQARMRDDELDRVPRALLDWSQTLPDGTHFTRPEKDQILGAIASQDSTTQAVLGLPGSGKSALLAEVANTLINDGVRVLTIKADLLDPAIETEDDLAEWLGLTILPSAMLWRISQLRPVVLMIDQLDALAGYTDIKTGRLSVLLSLVRRVSGRTNVHVVLSAREFEYEHDARLKSIKAETIHLDLPPWSEVLPVLERNGFNPAGWPADAQEVLRSPQALNTFLKLEERSSEPYRKYQLMLDQMWAETITRQPGGSRLAQLVTDIADQMAEKEVLWLPAARFDQHSEDITYLVRAGLLSDLGQAGSKIGFSHQTMFEHALARSFTRSEGRLSEFAIARQTSLFVRPKLWSGLTYLREVDPAAYDVEMQTLFHTPDLRLHLRTLLVEFLGQQATPDAVEVSLFDEALASDRRPAALMAMAGSPGWFERYRHTEIPRAMNNDREAVLALGVLDLAWAFAPDEVERLIVENWSALPDRDGFIWAALGHARVWTPGMVEITRALLRRTTIHARSLEYTISTIGTSQPDVAIQLLLANLDKELQAAKQESAARLASAPKENGDEYWKWRISSSPREPITSVVEQANAWDTLEALGKDNPALFLNTMWPWLTEAMISLRDLERGEDSLDYPVQYTLDFKFEQEERGRGHSDAPILSAIRVALETLAFSDEESFLAWLSEHEQEEFSPAQRLFSHVLSLYPEKYAQAAHRFLQGDPRRFRLGNHEDPSATTKRLIAQVSPHWSGADVEAFVAAVYAYDPTPYADLDAKGRKLFSERVRRIKLGLLSALPSERLPEATRRLVMEERRRFPRSDEGIRHYGPSWIGSPISAEQLAKAQDDEVLNAFRQLPDKYEWDHPNRMMEGGNIQLSRAFAEFAKTDPQRAASLIRRFEPSFGTRAAGYALEAIAEAGDPQLVMTLMKELDGRGFTGDEFTNSASEAARRLVRREIAVSSEILDLIEKWLNESVAPDLVPAQAANSKSEDDDLELLDMGAEKASEKDPSRREKSILWGMGSAVSSGNFPKLDVLVHALLLADQHDRVLALLTRAGERGEDERVWTAILHWFRYLKPTDSAALERLLDAVFDRYPALLKTNQLAILFAYLHWRHADFVRTYLERWATSGDEYFEQLAGELTPLIAFLQPELSWTKPLLEQIVFGPGTEWTRLGAINAAVNLFPDVEFRDRASELLVRIIPMISGVAWNNLFDVFRLVDEITPDPSWLALLTAIEANLAGAQKINATFVVDRLQTLLPHHALLVARIAKHLIETWRDELGDIQTGTAGSASELVDLAITLHRIGEETREIGLELFEQLVEIQAYTAKETLEQIDNRFRTQAPQRQRLPRRNRAAKRGRGQSAKS